MESLPVALEQLPAAKHSLRIALVTETWPPEVNGVAMTLARIVQGLGCRGHRVQLIRPRQGAADNPGLAENLEQMLRPGVPIPRYSGLRLGLPATRALRQLWAANRPDVVHIATEGPLGWSALNAALGLGIPATSSFHTNFHNYSGHYGIGWLRKPIAAYLRRFHNRAFCTLVPSHRLKEEMAVQGYRNLVVLGRGVDTNLFHPGRRSTELRRRWGAMENDLVALYVGRLAREKNLVAVADSFEAVRARRPGSRLVWVGDGPARPSLQARHPDHIFAGVKIGEELAAHYASADIFLFPSLTETFGNVTLEAMASGLAVIAYNYAAAEEHIRHGENGLVADIDNARQFRDLAARLGSDPEFAKRLGRNACRSMEGMSWDAVCDRFEGLLMEARKGEAHDGENCRLLASD